MGVFTRITQTALSNVYVSMVQKSEIHVIYPTSVSLLYMYSVYMYSVQINNCIINGTIYVLDINKKGQAYRVRLAPFVQSLTIYQQKSVVSPPLAEREF